MKIPNKFRSSDGTFTVIPDDSVQLAGYDMNGEEVYDGDELVNEDGEIYFAAVDFGTYVVEEVAGVKVPISTGTSTDELTLKKGE